MRKRRILAFLLALAMLVLSVPFTATATEDTLSEPVAETVTETVKETEKEAKPVVSFKGFEAYKEENGGVSVVFSVDKAVVAELEKTSKVAYGVVVGLGTYKGVTYNTAKDLRISGNIQDGYGAASVRSRTATVYATGVPEYTTNEYSNPQKDEFTVIAVADEATKDMYSAGIVFAAFAVTVDADGNENVTYVYAENDLFGREDSRYGVPASVSQIANYYVNDYSGNALAEYAYATDELLRDILTVSDIVARTAEAPVSLAEFEKNPSLAKDIVTKYVKKAREAYVKPEYAGYTTSIIGDFETGNHDYNDRPLPVSFDWSSVASGTCRYTLYVSESENFYASETQKVSTYVSHADIYNLKTDTTYYWKVRCELGGFTYETPVSTVTTADTVRWIYVDNVRNVRDMGGWNGLTQGLIYRGSELNLVGTHGLSLSADGKKVMSELLGITTDLDFRAEDQNGGKKSPIGEDTVWLNLPIGNFMSLYSSQTMFDVIKTFAYYENYPIYMHCWGGADRTGTVAFMIEGLCGVSEEDLAIDLELTSFASFGYRYRYDNGAYIYASMMARMYDYAGDTLQEKFETCARVTMGLTLGQISNIQAINTTEGAILDLQEGEDGNYVFEGDENDEFTMYFIMRNSKNVTSFSAGGEELAFSFDEEVSMLSIAGSELSEKNIGRTTATVTFDDGCTLTFTFNGGF